MKMNRAPALTQVVIVLTEHPVLGMLLVPYTATRGIEGTLQLVEQAFHASAETLEQMDETEQKAIGIASYYTEKYLMGVYSKDKTVPKFLRKLADNPDKIKNVIRPFIEKKLLEVIELIRDKQLPFYQKQPGSKQLYAHHAYHVHKHDIETRFSFKADSECFSYQLRSYCNGQPLSLREHKPVVVLTSNPATLILGMELYTFRHIEASRLLPFTHKVRISVDASQTQKYIDNILIPIARFHKMEAEGIDIRKEKRTCEALLYLEETIYQETLLRLNFRYGNQLFIPQDSNDMKKFVFRKKENNSETIYYFERDYATEKRAILFLEETGLQQISDTHFKLSGKTIDKNIPQWIDRHRELLQQSFVLTSPLQNKPYCLDPIRIEQSTTDGPDWFELHITVIIGDLRIPFSRFRKHILEENREYTLPDGRIILLPEEWFSKYANLLEIGTGDGKEIRLPRTFTGIVEAISGDNDQMKQPLYHPEFLLPPPPGLKAQLRHYQQEGFSWMVHLNKQGLNGCLADDMGLGKTLQTLTLLQYIYQRVPDKNKTDIFSTEQDTVTDGKGQFSLFGEHSSGNTLPGNGKQPDMVTATRKPGSLIVVPTSLLHNWRREAKRFTTLSMTEFNSSSLLSASDPSRYFDRYHLIFTTYGMVRNNIGLLNQYSFEYIVLDESQNIKNSDSLTFRCITQLRSQHRLTLTGTPIENSLKDLWAQFHFLEPTLLDNENAFNKRFINPIKQEDNRIMIRLRQLVSPFILRRSKSEVAPELPPLTEEIIYCNMTDEQEKIYRQEKNGLRNILLKLNIGQKQPQHQNFTVLNGILRLRQLACHPQMVLPGFNGYSGKLEQIIDTFETLKSEGHKVLIFSSFVKHLELIATEFRKRQWPYALLTGSSTNRPEEIARFTGNEEIQAFLISLKAGGVGLNLTQADYVFIIDPWWNPAAEAQAIGRAHRIGQDKQVIAYRFITQGSIEEKIIRLQENKKKLADTFITESETLPALTDKEWAELLEG